MKPMIDSSDQTMPPVMEYWLRSYHCGFCMLPWSLLGGDKRIILGRNHFCHGITSAAANIVISQNVSLKGSILSQHFPPPVQSSELEDNFVLINSHQEGPKNTDGQGLAFVIHDVCWQYFQYFLRLGVDRDFTRSCDSLWTVVRTLEYSWPIRRPTCLRARLALDDALLDRRALGMQENLTARSSKPFAELIKRLGDLSDELKLKISLFIEPSPYYQIAHVSSQVLTAMEYIEQKTLSIFQVDGVELNLRVNIYFSSLRLAGRNYLTEISNEAFPGAGLLAKKDSFDCLVVTIDEIGIVDLELAIYRQPPKSGPPKYDGISRWYRILKPLKNRNCWIKLIRKGMIFSDIVPPVFSNFLTAFELWDTPRPVNHSGLPYFTDPPYILGEQRIKAAPSLVKNHCLTLERDISAIVVLLRFSKNDGDPCVIQTVNNTARVPISSRPWYGISRSKVTVLYFPLAKGERADRIWVRYASEDSRLALVVRTSQGRERSFGPYIEPDSPPNSHHFMPLFNHSVGPVNTLVYSTYPMPDDEESTSNKIIRFGATYDLREYGLNFKQYVYKPPAEYSPVPSPLNAFDNEEFYGFRNRDWFFSTAELDGVLAVQTCTDNKREDEPTIGLLLHYANDRKEVVGQWREDLTLSNLLAQPTRLFIHRYRYSNLRSPPVKVIVAYKALDDPIEFNVPDPEMQKDMDEVAFYGHLVWWFSHYGDSLDHYD